MLRNAWCFVVIVALSAACSDQDSGPGAAATSGASGSSGPSPTPTSSSSSSSGVGGSSGETTGSVGGSSGGADDSGASGAGGSGGESSADASDGSSATPDGGVRVTDAGTMFGPVPPGMMPIFDGKTLTGWNGNPQIWSVNVADGAIYGKTDNGGQLIKTVGTYDTFRLIVTERMVATNNHLGICFWGGGKTPWGYDQCIVLIGPQGSLWDYKSGGGVYRGTGDNSIRFMWHQVEILANAATGQILAAVNGKQTTDYTKAVRALKGPIGLQAHAGALEVEYKEIFVDPAPKDLKLLTIK
jgi:3-keto-disaccharide hydrolase